MTPRAPSSRNSSPNDRTPTKCRPSASPPDTQLPRKPRTRELLPLASQIQPFQYVIEEYVQRKLRVRPPAAHAQVRQDKFPEPLEVQFRRNALPALTFRHLRPREKETVGLLRWRDPNGMIPGSCGWIR